MCSAVIASSLQHHTDTLYTSADGPIWPAESVQEDVDALRGPQGEVILATSTRVNSVSQQPTADASTIHESRWSTVTRACPGYRYSAFFDLQREMRDVSKVLDPSKGNAICCVSKGKHPSHPQSMRGYFYCNRLHTTSSGERGECTFCVPYTWLPGQPGLLLNVSADSLSLSDPTFFCRDSCDKRGGDR